MGGISFFALDYSKIGRENLIQDQWCVTLSIRVIRCAFLGHDVTLNHDVTFYMLISRKVCMLERCSQSPL